jgi:hypothetical protein
VCWKNQTKINLSPTKWCGCEVLQQSFNLLDFFSCGVSYYVFFFSFIFFFFVCSWLLVIRREATWKLSITFFSGCCCWRGVVRRSDIMSAGARTLSHTPDVNVSKEETKKIREYKKKYSSRHHVLFHSKTLMIKAALQCVFRRNS